MFRDAICRIFIFLIHFWLWIEYIVIKILPSSLIRPQVESACRLDAENKGIVTVADARFYTQVASKSLLGLCESYKKGWIRVIKLEKMFENILRNEVTDNLVVKYKEFLDYLEFDLFRVKMVEPIYDSGTVYKKICTFFILNLRKICSILKIWALRRNFNLFKIHYIIAKIVIIQIFSCFPLDAEVTALICGSDILVSCALWLSPSDTLDTAQANKMASLALQLRLTRGMRILEIGGGFGSMAKFLADKHGVHVVTTTTLREEVEFAKRNCAGSSVDVRLSDGKNLLEKVEKFDRILAIEVLEHVWRTDYADFFSNISQYLKPEGLFVLQCNGLNDSKMGNVNGFNPGVRFPYLNELITATQGHFVLEELKNIGPHYEKTWQAWASNFAKGRKRFAEMRGEAYCREWEFATALMATLSKLGMIQVWNFTFSKKSATNL